VWSIGLSPVVWSRASHSPGNPFEGEAVEGRDCGQLAKSSSTSGTRCGPTRRSEGDHSFSCAAAVFAQFGKAGAVLRMSSSLMSGSTMPELRSEPVSGLAPVLSHPALHLGRGVQHSQGISPLHSWLVWSVCCSGLVVLDGGLDVGAALVLRLASGWACDVRVAGLPPMSTVFFPGRSAYVGGGGTCGRGGGRVGHSPPSQVVIGFCWSLADACFLVVGLVGECCCWILDVSLVEKRPRFSLGSRPCGLEVRAGTLVWAGLVVGVSCRLAIAWVPGCVVFWFLSHSPPASRPPAVGAGSSDGIEEEKPWQAR